MRLLILLCLPALLSAAEPSEADKRIVQTVQRLGSFDYAKASAKTKEAINRYLTATSGTAEYFQLVEKYSISEQKENLLTLAATSQGTPAGGQSVKLLYQLGLGTAVTEKLKTLPAAEAAPLAESLASIGSAETTPTATALLSEPATSTEIAMALVTGMARHAAGQASLLDLAKAGKLPEAVKASVASALATSTDEAVRTAAAAVIPMAAVAALPPVAELMQKTGDIPMGQTAYMSYCFVCHQVNGQGIDFGPALSEIGSKLPKEALYEAILKPSAAISFGFEGWTFMMKDGSQFAGIIASETDTEVSLKLPGGILQKCTKADITSRKKLEVSMMTPNLHTVMSQPDLINLVEYLASLKQLPPKK